MRFECKIEFKKGEDVIIKVEPHRIGVRKVLDCKVTYINGENVSSRITPRWDAIRRSIAKIFFQTRDKENLETIKIVDTDQEFIDEVIEFTKDNGGKPMLQEYVPIEKVVVSKM